jgi:uncharacterized protein (DUF1778 family)
MKKEKEVKIRYTPEEFEIIKKKASDSKKSLKDYQKDVSKNAKVIIELREE